ncbi:Na+/H+-dicarboxylate symporter [Melghiribacillus thermohalophilus]|uniref:Na+/H+-dicarboxylate symporter n=1 Tax=Melghiribacillus thermohalophilus TaxID=1324956 RepID=A0A4R3N0X3_9BACI|nr:dicarboxylate/amino acid:cation symporter [Melghiribacillus thermohalophilus]TCT22445.1 Na+/H+-dicarboxylate symporter [Melghiribacillus thermohalophilus]
MKNILTQILLAFILAIFAGSLLGEHASYVQPLGDLFLRLIKFIVVPLVLASLVVGVASTGNVKKLGRMGGKTVLYYLATTAIAIVIGLAAGNLFSPGSGLNISEESAESVEAQEPPEIVDTILNIVPTNPISSLAEGNILQIIFFAIFIGLGITMLGEKAATVRRFFEQFAEIMYKITGIVMRYAPIGVFGLVAPIIGEYGLSVLMPLIKVLAALVAGVAVHAAVTYSLAVKFLANMSPLKFFKGIAPASIVAFSTQSSSGTLPVTIKSAEEHLGVKKEVSSFVLPLGATINMDGTALYQGVCALFVAQFFGIDLSFSEQLTIVLTATLASIGTAGVPGAGLIMLTMVLTSVNLPLEGIALIAGIDRVLDMFRTSLNVTGDGSAAVIVSASESKHHVSRDTSINV